MHLVTDFILSDEFKFYKAVKSDLAEGENCCIISNTDDNDLLFSNFLTF